MHCTKLLLAWLVLLAAGCSSVPQQQEDEERLDVAMSQYQRALKVMEAGRSDDALKRFVQLAKRYPELAGPYANQGLLLQQRGENERAAAAFDRAVELEPESGEIYNAAALFYRTMGRFEDAEAAYLKAIKQAPLFADPVLNLAILYDLYLQQPQRALKYYRRYLSLIDHEDKQVEMWLADLERRVK